MITVVKGAESWSQGLLFCWRPLTSSSRILKSTWSSSERTGFAGIALQDAFDLGKFQRHEQKHDSVGGRKPSH